MSIALAPGRLVEIGETRRGRGATPPRRVAGRGVAALVGVALLSSLAGPAGAAETVRRQVQGRFDDVKAGLVAAIEGKGLVINTVAHVGDMLARTGQDLGATRRVYEKAEVLEFCSATVSRATMEADPHAIVYCPYTIAVYVIAGQPGTVHVAYRRPRADKPGPAADALALVGKLLDDIVGEALLF